MTREDLDAVEARLSDRAAAEMIGAAYDGDKELVADGLYALRWLRERMEKDTQLALEQMECESGVRSALRARLAAAESLAAEAVRLLRRINDDATPSEPEDGSFAASRERYFAALTESRAFLARADVAALPKGENNAHE